MSSSDAAVGGSAAGTRSISACRLEPIVSSNIGHSTLDERMSVLLDCLVGASGGDSAIVFLRSASGILRRGPTVGLSDVGAAPPADVVAALDGRVILHDHDRASDTT